MSPKQDSGYLWFQWRVSELFRADGSPVYAVEWTDKHQEEVREMIDSEVEE